MMIEFSWFIRTCPVTHKWFYSGVSWMPIERPWLPYTYNDSTAIIIVYWVLTVQCEESYLINNRSIRNWWIIVDIEDRWNYRILLPTFFLDYSDRWSLAWCTYMHIHTWCKIVVTFMNTLLSFIHYPRHSCRQCRWYREIFDQLAWVI